LSFCNPLRRGSLVGTSSQRGLKGAFGLLHADDLRMNVRLKFGYCRQSGDRRWAPEARIPRLTQTPDVGCAVLTRSGFLAGIGGAEQSEFQRGNLPAHPCPSRHWRSVSHALLLVIRRRISWFSVAPIWARLNPILS